MSEPDPPAPSVPCGWTALGCAAVTADEPTANAVIALQAATGILWALSGRRFGVCDVTVRPCRQPCAAYPWGYRGIVGPGPWVPALIGGEWFNLRCGECGDDCGCATTSSIDLPGPVNAITEVKVDGTALTAGDDYVLYDHERLYRIGARWPTCQDLTAADTEADTWSVTFTRGLPLPVEGQVALGALACEILSGLDGGECKLPARVTNLNRQGVDLTIADPQDFLSDGRTGLFLVDMWLAAVNPNSLDRAPTFFSLDAPPARRPT